MIGMAGNSARKHARASPSITGIFISETNKSTAPESLQQFKSLKAVLCFAYLVAGALQHGLDELPDEASSSTTNDFLLNIPHAPE